MTRRHASAHHASGKESLGGRIADAYHEEVDRTHRSLLLAWVGFAVTFGLLRALTYAIHEGVGPFGDISIGGAHLHHYVWGIALLMAVGLFSLIVDSPRYNPWLGLVYGVGSALVLDEWALLLNLRDVYWADEGRVSVDAAIGCLAVLGIYLSAASFWRRATREVTHPSHEPASSARRDVNARPDLSAARDAE
jgi:hypothetical protein